MAMAVTMSPVGECATGNRRAALLMTVPSSSISLTPLGVQTLTLRWVGLMIRRLSPSLGPSLGGVERVELRGHRGGGGGCGALNAECWKCF
jgi:hypothetical protein